MLMHRKGQRCGAAELGEAANKTANLAVVKTATPEFLRYKRRKEFCSPHLSIVLGDESVSAIVCGGPVGEPRAERDKSLFPIYDRACHIRLPPRVLRSEIV